MTARQDAERAATFVMERVQAKWPYSWCVEFGGDDGGHILQSFVMHRIRGVPELAATALVAWGDGQRNARVFDTPLEPLDVLDAMANGWRPVSLIDRQDALEFALHDLCHLEKFHGADRLQQIGFFRWLRDVVTRPEWQAVQSRLAGDDKWRYEYDRVCADMNGHSLFLFCAFRAALRAACRRQAIDFEPTFELVIEGAPVEDAMRHVRTRDSAREHLVALETYFTARGK